MSKSYKFESVSYFTTDDRLNSNTNSITTETTERLKVPKGWLVRSAIIKGRKAGYVTDANLDITTTPFIFVEDEHHTWELD